MSATAVVRSDQRAADRGGPVAGWQRPWVLAALFALVLLAAAAVRLWQLGRSPAWQWDEAVYWNVAVNVQHGALTEHPLSGVAWQPFLYQPPFYLLMLAGWFDAFGATIYHARLMGVTSIMLTFALIFRLLWKVHGPKVALFAIIPVIFDGWLIYIQRVSYIENVLLLIIVGAFLLYQRALEKPSWHRFALAGIALALAAIFKQTGAYALVAVLLCWLIVRRAHKGHLVLLGAAFAVILAYIVAMHRMYDLPGRPWFTNQSLVQLRRVLGLQQSGGTLTSPGALIHLLEAQYRYFVPSVLVGLTALVVALRKLGQCYRARSWEPAQPNALLFSWMASGVVIFGFSSLKFPQYFALILIPSYLFLWTEVARADWSRAWKTAVPAVAVVASVGCFALTVPAYSYNTLAKTAEYAAAHIPPNATVVTEQSIGDLINQPWCTVKFAAPCLHTAKYAITWRTYLQSSFTEGHASFHELMKGAVRVKSFSGPVGTATVWKLKGTSS
ncbi:MAG TPA: glycosyltransferase family 39 protein [Streptosporangiaceae bacterium]|jgi:4-amino-4-deoxy-L-arabinose transferase-like glycosyltransferase|nr:glycosyltransferase family 39 protein [Streptosporangiaceae bacterium]